MMQRSIRTRLLAGTMAIILVTLALIIAAATFSAREVRLKASQQSAASLRSQAQTLLVQINAGLAAQNDLILDRAARDVNTIASVASEIYNQASGSPYTDLAGLYWSVQRHMLEGENGQYLNGPEDISSVFVPNFAALDKAVVNDIQLTAYLDTTLAAVMKNNPNTSAAYIGTVHEVTRYYPNIELGKLVPPDFQITQRPWYLASLAGNASVSEAHPVWSPVYQDATGLGLVTTVAVPVYDRDGSLAGVVGLDLTLDEVQNIIERARFSENGYSFLIDQEGKTIVLPAQGYMDILGRPQQPGEFGIDLLSLETQTAAPEFAATIRRMVSGETGFQNVHTAAGSEPAEGGDGGPREVLLAFTPLENTGWSLGSVVPAGEVVAGVADLEEQLQRSSQAQIFTLVLPLIVGAGLILMVVGYFFTNRLVRPIQDVARAAARIGTGEWDTLIPVDRQDEVGVLASTINEMTAQLRQSFAELESRVADRTSELERRSLQLQTAAEIARDVSVRSAASHAAALASPRWTERDEENAGDAGAGLLQNAVDLITERFDLYHAAIFLMDEAGEYAYLSAASGPAGAQLLSQGLKLRVGWQGIIGYVTRYGQPRLTSNVAAEKDYMADALLPQTRSELAVPLRAGGRTLGALDVQSTRPNAFTAEDLAVMQTLADQLAVAIENARLVERLQVTLKETAHLYQESTRQAWERTSQADHALTYLYDGFQVQRVSQMPDTSGPLHDPSSVQLVPPSPAPTNPGQAERDPGDQVTPVQYPPASQPGEALVPHDNDGWVSPVSHSLQIPVRLREQTIGFIRLESEDLDHPWTEDEIAVVEATANQVAQTVENARLLAEASQRAAREQMTSEVTAQMRASLDVDIVLQTAVREIAERLGLPQVEVYLTSEPQKPAPMEPGQAVQALQRPMIQKGRSSANAGALTATANTGDIGEEGQG